MLFGQVKVGGELSYPHFENLALYSLKVEMNEPRTAHPAALVAVFPFTEAHLANKIKTTLPCIPSGADPEIYFGGGQVEQFFFFK